jgi:hypothetical protein
MIMKRLPLSVQSGRVGVNTTPRREPSAGKYRPDCVDGLGEDD